MDSEEARRLVSEDGRVQGDASRVGGRPPWARVDDGVLSTEINHAVGEDAVLVHHVFENSDALVHYFSTTATQHMAALIGVAKPELHLIRGTSIQTAARDAIGAKKVPSAFGELLFGYVKEDYRRPDRKLRSTSQPSGLATPESQPT